MMELLIRSRSRPLTTAQQSLVSAGGELPERPVVEAAVVAPARRLGVLLTTMAEECAPPELAEQEAKASR